MIEKSRLKELEQNITSKQKEMEEVKAKRGRGSWQSRRKGYSG